MSLVKLSFSVKHIPEAVRHMGWAKSDIVPILKAQGLAALAGATPGATIGALTSEDPVAGAVKGGLVGGGLGLGASLGLKTKRNWGKLKELLSDAKALKEVEQAYNSAEGKQKLLDIISLKRLGQKYKMHSLKRSLEDKGGLIRESLKTPF